MDSDITGYAHVPPQYQETLALLQNILDFQTSLAEKVESSFQVDRAVARERWQAGLPLLTGELPRLSPSWFQEAVIELRSLLPPEEAVHEALDRLLSSDFMKPSNIETLLDELLGDSKVCIQRLADATSTSPDVQARLVHTILSPFFQKQVAPYREWIETATWRRGICPMCGSEPGIARLSNENGQYLLTCSLCHTEWSFDRLRCPFCESDDQPRQRYFTVEGDRVHRVNCCDRCQRYIKAVDERALGHQANLLVEDVITAYMDGLAREQGYQ